MTGGEAYKAKLLTSALVLACAWGAAVWSRRKARRLDKLKFAYRSPPRQVADVASLSERN